MLLNITGEIEFRIANFGHDSSVEGSKMPTVDLIVRDTTTPCIIRRISYGKIESLGTEETGNVSIMVFTGTRQIPNTRKSFMDVQITTEPVQFSVYIHTNHLEKFLGACAMYAVRKDLKT